MVSSGETPLKLAAGTAALQSENIVSRRLNLPDISILNIICSKFV